MTPTTYTHLDPPTDTNFRNGERVRIAATGDRPYLDHTVGLFGFVQNCIYRARHIIVVRFEGGGQFSYPRHCIEKAPKS